MEKIPLRDLDATFLKWLGPGSASVLLNGGCGWHGFVEAGRVG